MQAVAKTQVAVTAKLTDRVRSITKTEDHLRALLPSQGPQVLLITPTTSTKPSTLARMISSIIEVSEAPRGGMSSSPTCPTRLGIEKAAKAIAVIMG